jgi:AcrR family transcriptional regulator
MAVSAKLRTKRAGEPKRRTADATRAAILRAARRRFARNGFEETGLRDIAAAAGIDAALVCRYFGSKQKLFAAALAAGADFSDIFDGPPADMGRRMAEHVLAGARGENEELLVQLMLVSRSLQSPPASAALSRHMETNFLGPLRERLRTDNSPGRAALIAACMLGTAILRYVLKDKSLSGTVDPAVVASFGIGLQSLVEFDVRAVSPKRSA